MRRSVHAVALTAAALLAVPAQAQLFADDPIPLDGVLGLWLAAPIAPTIDVDGDGLPDALAVHSPSGTATVLLGRSDGTLGEAVVTVSEAFGLEVGAGDVDADGRTDLVGLSSDDTAVLAQLALADGSFAAPVESALPFEAGRLLVDDVTGDGLADVVVLEAFFARVAILAGDGAGAFEPAAQFAIASNLRAVAAGDATGDGLVDVVVVSAGTQFGSTTVWLIAGSASGFDAPVEVFGTTGKNVVDVAVVDLVGDAVPDVVLADQASPFDTVVLTALAGSPSLASGGAVEVAIAGGLAGHEWTLTDVDDDAVLDLVSASLEDDAVLVTRLGVAGGFGAPIVSGVLDGVTATFTVLDATRDGAPDVVVSDFVGARVLAGDGSGSFGRTTVSNGGVPPLVGRIDGDLLPDLVVATIQDDAFTISVMRGTGGGKHAVTASYALPTQPFATALDDVDLDGDLDVLAVTPGVLQVLLNDGSGALSSGPALPVAITLATVVGDVTGDGLVDVTTFDVAARRFVAQGDGTFVEELVGPADIAVGEVVPVLGDVDGDGIDDALIVDRVRTSAATQAGSFVLGNGGSTSLGDAALVDFEGDGEVELVITKNQASTGAPGLQVRRLDAGGTFVNAFFVTIGEFLGDIDVADLDGDGLDDVVTTVSTVSSDGRVAAFTSDGLGELELLTDETFGHDVFGVTVVDADGDGALDLVTRDFDTLHVVPAADATWTALGESLAGPAGLSGLFGVGPLASDAAIELRVERAAPLAASTLVVGFTELSAPFAGGVLVPSPGVLVSGLVTDGLGGFVVPAVLPSGVPAGVELFAQLWQGGAGSFSATTAVRGVTR